MLSYGCNSIPFVYLLIHGCVHVHIYVVSNTNEMFLHTLCFHLVILYAYK